MDNRVAVVFAFAFGISACHPRVGEPGTGGEPGESDPPVRSGETSGVAILDDFHCLGPNGQSIKLPVSIFVPRRSLPRGGTFSDAEKLLRGARSTALGLHAPIPGQTLDTLDAATLPADGGPNLSPVRSYTGGPPPPRTPTPIEARRRPCLSDEGSAGPACQAAVNESEGYLLRDGVMFHGPADGTAAGDRTPTQGQPSEEHFVFVPCASLGDIATFRDAIELERRQPGSTVNFDGSRDPNGTFHLKHSPNWPH
jgi:hypothetical protein